MKVIDPQAALLTTAEVHHFLKSNPPRKPDKKSGAYEAVDLRNLIEVRKDFQRYIDLTSPHIKEYPSPPDKLIRSVVQRLRKYDLTKTEVLTILNLGLGVPRAQAANVNDITTSGASTTDPEVKDEEGAVDGSTNVADDTAAVEPNFRALADCVIESLSERFPGDEGEQKIDEILNVLKACVEEAPAA